MHQPSSPPLAIAAPAPVHHVGGSKRPGHDTPPVARCIGPAEPDAKLLQLGKQWRASVVRKASILADTFAIPIDESGSPTLKSLDDAGRRETDLARRLRREIVRLPAQTWAGIALKIEVVHLTSDAGDDNTFEDILDLDEDAMSDAPAMSLVRDLVAWMREPGAAPPVRSVKGRMMVPVAPDAELIALGRLFDDAWCEESKCWQAFPKDGIASNDDALWAAADAASKRTGAVADQIERITARTLKGLLVKLRVLSWTHSGEPFCSSYFSGSDHPTGDERVATSIFRDLAAMSDRPLAPPCPTVAARAA